MQPRPIEMLSDLGRQYADNIFNNVAENVVEKRQRDLIASQYQHAAKGSILSGSRFMDEVRLFLESIRIMAEARRDSLLQAYEKSAIPLDDSNVQEITNEVRQLCDAQHSIAVDALNRSMASMQSEQTRRAFEQEIAIGVTTVSSQVVRGIAIKYGEALLTNEIATKAYGAGLGKKWDVFICHASEDKSTFVSPLAKALDESGLSVWYDDITLRVGDSLRQTIDHGLANSRYGIVVLSKHFFEKKWPQQELDGLISREIVGTKVILPIWHELSFEEVAAKSPILAGRVAAMSSEGISAVVRKILEAMASPRTKAGSS
jgi:hypothetical protein